MKKKYIPALICVLAAAGLSACSRSQMPALTTETTVPLATVRPTVPRTETTVPREFPADTTPARTPPTTETAESTDVTVEDGNGPTPGQMSDFQF